MKILEILNQIAATSSKNEKLAIMQQHKDNEDLRNAFRLAYDPSVNFFMKKAPAPVPPILNYGNNFQTTLEAGLQYITINIASRAYTGIAAEAYVSSLLGDMDPEDAEVLARVIQKDLRVGASEGSINKVWPDLVYIQPVMLVESPDDELLEKLLSSAGEQGLMAQIKSDGVRAMIYVYPGSVVVRTRNGNIIDVCGRFDFLKDNPANFGMIFDGELMVRGADGKPLDRKTGNGLVNKAIKGTVTPQIAKDFFLTAWDIIPMTVVHGDRTSDEYWARFGRLVSHVNGCDAFELIANKWVRSMAEIKAFYDEARALGLEGIVVKSPKNVWRDSRVADMVKLKAVLDATLRIVDTYPGEGKYAGMIGGFIMESECGKLRNIRVGSGLTDADRKKDPSEFVGKLADITYNELITNKKVKDQYKMFLPIFMNIREDVREADTLEKLLKQK